MLLERCVDKIQCDIDNEEIISIMIMWTIKHYLVILTLCMQCDKFYNIQGEMQSACIQQLMKTKCSENKKYLCKRVVQLSRTFSKISACSLFTVGASFPLPLIGIMANYIIVLLQFAYL
ncbi:hypothetical protein HW555_012614 [Spodoptera exigua]|uniref:Uncharacterized protein n=1 Tax=Spodoptera exigua TaxID=7107 RepID=A0A835L3F1_SPOEX|nr:hypothetical protein HW555_012614 [Spodoptera exigua]